MAKKKKPALQLKVAISSASCSIYASYAMACPLCSVLVPANTESATFYFGNTMSGVKDRKMWQGRVSEVYWLDGAWRPATGLRMHGLTVTPTHWRPLPTSPESESSASDRAVQPEEGPIPLNEAQEAAAKSWAADDRLWTTQETVEFNLRTFAGAILAAEEKEEK